MPAAKKTTDHNVIRRWVERHGGHPATVKRTRKGDDVGMIRIDFPGFSGEKSLEGIGWDEWFEKFDEQKLAFLYQDRDDRNFNKLVRRVPDEIRPSDRHRPPSRTTRGGRAAARALKAGHKPKQSRGSQARSSGRNGSRDLQALTRAALYERARKVGVSRRSAMTKDELVRALRAYGK